MQANFELFIDERLALRVKWAGDRGRARAAEALVRELGKYSARIRARLSALGEAEEAQSSIGGLLCRCVGAMTRSDEGNGCSLLRRSRRSGGQRV
jgi:hypothetical protein